MFRLRAAPAGRVRVRESMFEGASTYLSPPPSRSHHASACYYGSKSEGSIVSTRSGSHHGIVTGRGLLLGTVIVLCDVGITVVPARGYCADYTVGVSPAALEPGETLTIRGESS